MRVITQIYSTLPTNQKSLELNNVLRPFVGCLFKNNLEVESFVCRLRSLIDYANAKFSRTTPYEVVRWGDHVSIKLPNTDKGLGITFMQITDTYDNKSGWFNHENN